MFNRLTRRAQALQVVPVPRFPAVLDRHLVMHQRCRCYLPVSLAPLTERISLPLRYADFSPSSTAVELLFVLVPSLQSITSLRLMLVAVTCFIIRQFRATYLPASCF